MKNSLKAAFKNLCVDHRMNMTKGKLMNLAFGKNYSGIDSAIPQSWVNENQGEDLFYFATDCTTVFFEVKNMLDLIPDNLAEKIIKMRELYLLLNEMIINLEMYQDTPEFFEYRKLHDELYNLMN